MRFIVAHDVFAESVAWVARSLPARPAIPILSGILIEAQEQSLTISVFDYEVSATETLPAQVFEPGSALLSGKLLAEICKLLPNADIEITSDETNVTLICSSTEFILPIMSTSDYPQLPALPNISGTLPVQSFSQAVNQVNTSSSKDDTIPMLTGIKVTIDGQTIILAATDRFRLAVKWLQWNPQQPDFQADLLIPARRLSEITKSIPSGTKEIEIALPVAEEDKIFGYTAQMRKSTSRLLDHQYPPYNKLIPEDHVTFINVSINLLAEAIRRVSLVAFRGAVIKLDFHDNSITVTAGGDDSGTAKEEIAAEIFGPDMTIAFNPQYILDGLTALQSTYASIALTNSNKAAVLREGPITPEFVDDNAEVYRAPEADFIYLVMPTRLPN